MLTFLDAVLCSIFSWVFQAVFVIASIFSVIVAIIALFGEANLREKLHWIGICLIMVSVTIFFFGWLGEEEWTEEDEAFAAASNPDFPDYSWVPAMVCALFALLALALPLLLRCFGVPTIVCGIIYMGIAIFGL